MTDPTEDAATDEATRELVIDARGLRVEGSRGIVVSDLDLAVPAGGVGVLQGPAGTGKTSVLLALGGRMKIRSGDVRVAGQRLPGHEGRVRRRVGLAEVAGVNDLDSTLSLSNHVAERLALVSRRPWSRRRDVDAALDRYAAALTAAEEAGGPALREVVDPSAIMADLVPVERAVLGAVLGSLGDPDLLCVDDNGYLRSGVERTTLIAALGHLVRNASRPMAVLLASTEVIDVDGMADTTGLPVELIEVVQMPISAESADRVSGAASSGPSSDSMEAVGAPESSELHSAPDDSAPAPEPLDPRPEASETSVDRDPSGPPAESEDTPVQPEPGPLDGPHDTTDEAPITPESQEAR